MVMADGDETIPSYLFTPPTTTVRPPVETRLGSLPYAELSWEDYERLCLKCARNESDVERAQPYGVRGQGQAGIDLYARLKSGSYRVYQCKNESGFGPAKIEAAVENFLAGKWRATAKELVLCTREILHNTQRSEMLERQTERLKTLGITLTPWDASALSEILKDLPEIVDDFFGRQWVKRFCGEDALPLLSQRLDGAQVRVLRTSLRSFYSNLFLIHDRGLPAAACRSNSTLSVYDRYVLPAIYHSHTSDIGELEQSSSLTSNDPTRAEHTSPTEPARSRVRHRQRVSLEAWLLQNDQTIVVADFGVGKTSLLRFIALDILDKEPRLTRLAMHWGNRLPVWIPYAFWTRLIADPETANTSLSDLLEKWFHSQEESSLWPLVRDALDDDRLLLLVDGLDEWSSETAANIAGQRLALFAKRRSLPMVAVGRSTGVSSLSLASQGWPVVELADFDTEQQRMLTEQWIRHWGRCEDPDAVSASRSTLVAAKIDELMHELSTPALASLARVPLLLSLLILLKLNNVKLPDDRFKAYDELLRHLIGVHPHRRREAAGVGETLSLTTEDNSKILAYLAFFVQSEHSDGVIEKAAATAAVEDFLQSEEGLGFDAPGARKYARELIATDGGSTGLLVRRSPDEISFFHRSLQEYLAAQHLAGLSLSTQLAIVEERCRDVTWIEVLLGLLRLTKRRDDLQQYIDVMERAKLNALERMNVQALLTEAAVGDFNLPPSLARRILDDAIATVEMGSWMPQRERLLSKVLRGIRQSPSGDRIREKVAQWFPGRRRREGLYFVLSKWRNRDGVFDILWRGLFDDEVSVQEAAAQALVVCSAGAREVADKLAQISRFNHNCVARAIAIDALATGWPTHDQLPHAIKAAHGSASLRLHLAAISAKITTGSHTAVDLQNLLELADGHPSVRHDTWGKLPFLLAAGWSKSQDLKDWCVRSFRVGGQPSRRNNLLEIDILLRSFPGDPDVGELLAQHIENDAHPFITSYDSAWSIVRENFHNCDRVIKAIDTYIDRSSFERDIVNAVLVGKTDKGKSRLLGLLEDSGTFIHWPVYGLLEGWGMNDVEVRDRLSHLAREPESGPRFASLLPRIITDKTLCNDLLLSMLQQDKCSRPDFVIAGLHNNGTAFGNSKACDAGLRHYNSNWPNLRAQEIAPQLIAAFSNDNRVRSIAVAQLYDADGDHDSVAAAFAEDVEIRSIILSRAAPLPTVLRDNLVVALSERPIGDQFAQNLLQLYELEDDAEIKTKASIAFHRRLSRAGNNVHDALVKLQRSIVSYGEQKEAQRQAALCGLLSLGRVDVFKNATEDSHNKRPSVVGLRSLFGVNYALLRCLGEHWAELRKALGESLNGRLVEFSSSKDGPPWDILSTVAADYPTLSRELVEWIESVPNPTVTSNILRFLALTRQKSLLLRQTCFDAFKRQRSSGPRDDIEATAAEILARDYEDAGTCTALLQLLPDMVPAHTAYGPLLALLDGWSLLMEVVTKARGLIGHRVPWDLLFAMYPLVDYGAEIFLHRMEEFFKHRSPYDTQTSRRVFRFCTRHLACNDDAYRLLVNKFLQRSSYTLYTSAPSLLVASRGIGALGRQQLARHLEKELGGQVEPHVGYDLRSDQVRSTALSLLDVLSSGDQIN